jgi:putative transposase
MRPDAAQREALARIAGARRSVWNWALAERPKHYRETGNTLPQSELSRRLPALKREAGTAWLEAVDSQALQQALADFERIFVNFFKKRARFPRFKSRKHDTARFRIPQRVRLADGKVYVPKAGFIRIRQSRPVEEETKSTTFRSWTFVCGLDHDRDLNAALNLHSDGLKLISLAAGQAERRNARRPEVRLPQVGSNRG